MLDHVPTSAASLLQIPSRCACGCRKPVGCKGIYLKGHQPAGTSCDPEGKAKANNSRNNPKWNPINKRKRKIERRGDAEGFLIEHGRAGILSDTRRKEIVEAIATDRSLFDDHGDERLDGKSLDDLFSDPTFCGYLGETKRTLDEEAYAWFTERGGKLYAAGKCRPVLRWKGGHKLITPLEAKTIFGFKSVFLWKNEEKPNTTFVEDCLQGRYHELGLPRRLHRQVGMGDNGFGDQPGVFELHKVFLSHLLVASTSRPRSTVTSSSSWNEPANARWIYGTHATAEIWSLPKTTRMHLQV
jgi:hypothetical protein